MDSKLTVISVGGSIISPDNVDITFVKRFHDMVRDYLLQDPERKLVLVCGGGAPARVYQSAYHSVAGDDYNPSQADWIGIKATHLNGMLMRSVFSDFCDNDLIVDPTTDFEFKSRILVAAGWKPGFSTDTDAVYLANKFGGKLVINLSNIAKVYDDNPKTNPNAKPLDKISWDDFCAMVGSEWVPGKNTPFDPIASSIARDNGIKVICADGRNIENTLAILKGEDFEGTVIG